MLRQINRYSYLKVLFILSGALIFGSGAFASTIAFDFDSAPTSSDSQLTLGFRFHVNQDLMVLALGYYDDAGDGLADQHDVGIFDAYGNLLVSTTVAAGTVDPLVGQFRYQTINPIALTAGQVYTIGATTNGPADPWAYGAAGSSLENFAADPALHIGEHAGVFVYQCDNLLQEPTHHYGYTIYAGPNFQFQTLLSTPEPGTGIILASALAVLSLMTKLRKKATPEQ
ncbi:MAG TPA: DUF4082 domain-containing protein [Bryobacteraceae bacterium]|jgi:hypothetical protein|nr:DUF4082 domain-containing protein [Bryobacteraceae bacterium]